MMMWKLPFDVNISVTTRFLLLIVLFTIAGCREREVYTPKPRGYFRIDLPQRHYAVFSADYCPFTFEYPDAYGDVTKKTRYFDDLPDHPCWLNIEFPYFNGTLHLSYVDVDSPGKLERVINDGYKYAFKHTIKADFIDQTTIRHDHTNGILFDIGGNAASNVQFYVTDSAQHYLRGSLYFNESPNVDSLRPVIDYLREDVLRLMQTVEWEG